MTKYYINAEEATTTALNFLENLLERIRRIRERINLASSKPGNQIYKPAEISSWLQNSDTTAAAILEMRKELQSCGTTIQEAMSSKFLEYKILFSRQIEEIEKAI